MHAPCDTRAAFEPFAANAGSYAGILAASVFVQEVTRLGVWWINT